MAIGRPPADIDLAHFEKLCAYHFTVEEMAAALNLSKRTLLRKIKEDPWKTLWDDGEANGRALVKRRGFEFMARDDAVGERAWEHQTKMILKFSEKQNVELTGKNGGPVQTIDLSKLTNDQIDQLERIASALAAAGGLAGGDQGGTPPTPG